MNRLHDVNGAAELLAISPWTVRAYIRQRTLIPVRIGRLVRLEEEELRRFVTQRRNSVDPLKSSVEAALEVANG